MHSKFRSVLRCTAAFLSVLFFACEQKLPLRDAAIITAAGEKIPIKIELAKTPDERARGFMHRKNIPEGTGMLFVFDYEQHLSFWMKNTPCALSIAFLDKNLTIKEIHHMEAFSLERTMSRYSCMYALEVPQGWFEKKGIQAGDRFILDTTGSQ